jgi:glycosyltransferase involved in cell wall biosynthesis
MRRGTAVPNVTLTIAICTHNRAEEVVDCLQALCAQDLSDVQDIVVDSASRPEAYRSLERTVANNASLELIRLKTPGISAARNAAVEAAAASWLGFLDDDVIPASDWVAQAKFLIATVPANCPIIAGRVDPLYPSGVIPQTGPRWRQLLSLVQDQEEGEYARDAKVVCGNAIFYRKILKEIGSFPLELGRVGDTLLSGEEKFVVECLCDEGWHVFCSHRLRVNHKIPPKRLTRRWAANRAFWDGVTDQKIRRLMGRPIGILGVAKIAAAILALAILCPVDSSEQEFFIRFWYNLGTIRDLFLPVQIYLSLP